MAAEDVLARYAVVAQLTAALRDAIESDQIELLDRLADQRAAELAAAEADLAALAGGAPLPADTAGRIRTALGQAIAEDDRLRALLAARAQELPRQLAELRGARTGLGGYQASVIAPEGELDRKG